VPGNGEIIEVAVRTILRELGYDLGDQHFEHTPERFAALLLEFSKNADDETGAEILEVVFDDEHDSLVVVGPTRVVSMCAHHMLPVTGWAWVGYIPDGHVVGISKLARIVHHYSRQFTVQERVTQQIAKLLMDQVKPKGVAVVIKARHDCMRMRGIEEPNALTMTSAVRGVFYDEPSTRDEFLRLIELAG
jgi:GTP cyclohydrolase IA